LSGLVDMCGHGITTADTADPGEWVARVQSRTARSGGTIDRFEPETARLTMPVNG
jgi:hypothetical protein